MTRATALLLGLLALLALAPAGAEERPPLTVSGIVMAPSGGRGDGPWGRYTPLAGVQVQMKGPVVANLNSDDNGMFRIANLLPGEYVLTLQADGYRKLTRSLDLSDGPPRGMLSFVLVPTD